MELTPVQQNKLLAMAEIADKGELAIVTKMFEMEDTFDSTIEKAQQAVHEATEALQQVMQTAEEVRELKNQTKQGDRGEIGKDGKDGAPGKAGRDGRDGRDGLDGRDGADGLSGENGKDGSPDTAEDIRNKLELLDGEDRLDAKAIKNLPESTKTIIREMGGHVGAFETPIKNSSGVLLSKDAQGAWRLPAGGAGTVVSVVGGTGISVDNTDPANPIVTATGGAGFTELAATGSVNSSNVTFTFTSVPSYIVADGIWLKKLDSNSNVQWSNVETTITMVNPPSNSIFGIA